MSKKKNPEPETIDLLITDQVRSLCAQFDEECRAAAKEGLAPRLDAYVAQVPETQRLPFRAELQRIQERYQHTQANIEAPPPEATIESGPEAEGAAVGTIDFLPGAGTAPEEGQLGADETSIFRWRLGSRLLQHYRRGLQDALRR